MLTSQLCLCWHMLPLTSAAVRTQADRSSPAEGAPVHAEADIDRLRARAREVGEAEGERFADRTRGSARMYKLASAFLPLGVASSFQTMEPYPVYLARGAGSHLWDVDGHEYLDYHNGFGVTICGHAHPRIVEAIERAARNGTQCAAMTEAAV